VSCCGGYGTWRLGLALLGLFGGCSGSVGRGDASIGRCGVVGPVLGMFGVVLFSVVGVETHCTVLARLRCRVVCGVEWWGV